MLNTTKVLISKALIDSYINHDKFVSVNNVLQEDNEMKEEIENTKNAVEYTTYIVTEFYCVSCKENTVNKNSSVRKIKQYRLMVVSNCAVCGKKKLRVIMNPETSRLKLH